MSSGMTHSTVSKMIASHLYVMGYGTIKHVVLRFKWVKVHGEWKLSRRKYLEAYLLGLIYSDPFFQFGYNNIFNGSKFAEI